MYIYRSAITIDIPVVDISLQTAMCLGWVEWTANYAFNELSNLYEAIGSV